MLIPNMECLHFLQRHHLYSVASNVPTRAMHFPITNGIKTRKHTI